MYYVCNIYIYYVCVYIYIYYVCVCLPPPSLPPGQNPGCATASMSGFINIFNYAKVYSFIVLSLI